MYYNVMALFSQSQYIGLAHSARWRNCFPESLSIVMIEVIRAITVHKHRLAWCSMDSQYSLWHCAEPCPRFLGISPHSPPPSTPAPAPHTTAQPPGSALQGSSLLVAGTAERTASHSYCEVVLLPNRQIISCYLQNIA